MAYPYFLRVAYAGGGFHGWQIQSVLRSGQGVLWDALRRLDDQVPMPQGTGRTDAGVHARGQGVLATLSRPWEPYRLLAAVNAHLPWDLRVMSVQAAPDGFFPRQHAVGKRYVYRLGTGPAADPLAHGQRWHVHGAAPLEVAATAEAGACLVGTHDFSSFRCAECVAPSPVRTLHACRIQLRDGGLDLVFEGDRFLMHQVRIMTGTLVDVGRGRRPAGALEGILAARDRRAAGPTAPPEGLCLDQIWYEARWGIGDPCPFGDQSR